MALVLDERGLLPDGVHEATLEEVDAVFARFQKSDRRLKLFARLRNYLVELKKAVVGESVIIDGSFVMPCVDEPEDIDIILVMAEDWDMKADLKPYQYNLVSKKRVKKDHGFDLAVVSKNSPLELEWISFFSQVRPKWCQRFGWPKHATKGLVRVTP